MALVVGAGVLIEEGAVIRDSIVMRDSHIGKNTRLYKTIVAESSVIGSGCEIGIGDYAESEYDKKVYNCDLAVIGEKTNIPEGVVIGKNTAILGNTTIEDYVDRQLLSGDFIVKVGDRL